MEDPGEIESETFQQKEEQNQREEDVIRAIWIKEDTDWAPLQEDEPGTQLKTIDRFHNTHIKRKLKLLGHAIRADNDDPLRQVSLKPGAATLNNLGKKKWGNLNRTGCKKGWRRFGKPSGMK